MLHKKAILGEIHKVHNWEYPNATARAAATGFTSEDIGKVAWQKDNDSFWFLKSNSPVIWQSFANDPSIITEQDLIENIRSAGVVELPTFVYNNDGTCTVGTGQFSLYDNPSYQGVPRTFIISGTTLNLTDNSANYILASYNNGTPIYEVVTSVPPTNTTDSDRIPVYSIYRSGNDVHYFDWDHLALGLAEKLNQRIRRTDRFRIDNGLGLSATGRTIEIAAGQVWAGANIVSLNAIDSTNPEVHFYYHQAGNWVRGNLSQFNNSQYDNGTNLVTLTNNKYAVNWVYRSVQQNGAIYVLLGNGDYSLIEAQSSKEPAKPTEISTQAILVGRIIALKGASTATQIDRVIDVTFGANSVANHNDLSGIQGGISNEHWHLTQAQSIFVDNLDNLVTTDGTKIGIGNTNPAATIDVGVDPNYVVPAVSPTPVVVASDTGGSIPAGTYYFKVVTFYKNGSSAASLESNPAVITTSTGSITLSVALPAGVAGYNVYCTSTSGTYNSPSLLATSSASSLNITSIVLSSGTPNSTSTQNDLNGKEVLNDIVTNTTVSNYGTNVINQVLNPSTNQTGIANAQVIYKTIPADNPYNFQLQRSQLIYNNFRGSGTMAGMTGTQLLNIYSGMGSSIGGMQGIIASTGYTGTNTVTTSQITGVSGAATLNSAGRATNMYGLIGTASVGSGNIVNPTAGNVYGVRGDANHTSTGKTVDAMWGSYGHANATATNGTVTRIQGGYFQASSGNGTGGGSVTAQYQRGVEGWAYQNNTSTSDEVTGGLFTGTALGKVNAEVRGAQINGENRNTVGTTPLTIGGKMYALNYGTTDQVYGAFAEVQHNANNLLPGATGVTTAVINNSGGTITEARGVQINILNNSGAINTGIGVYIGSIQATDPWGIWQASSAAKNYFGGKALFNRTTDDGSVLQVEGQASVTSLRVQAFGDGSIYPVISRNGNGGLTIDSPAGGGSYGEHKVQVAGSTALMIASNKNVGIGTEAPISQLHVNKNTAAIPAYDATTNESAINVSAEDNRTAKIQTFAFNSGSNVFRFNYARGTASAPLYPTTLSSLGSISWRGWDENTSTWLGGATITAIPDSDWNATTRDTCIRFFTTKGTTSGEKIRISSSGNLLINTTTDDGVNKLQVNGYIKHNAGWRDNIAQFAKASAGVAAPTLTTLANGVRVYEFSANDSVHVEFHTDHDIVPNSLAFPHVHFFSVSPMTAGQTVIWQFIYASARGHSQGDSLTAARTTLTMTYTADGTEVAGEHIVLESTTGITLIEPDQLILAEYKYTGGTHTGAIYGVMGDLHYQSDREVTLNKAPNFYA